MNASISNDWGRAVELAQQKIGMRPTRLANLLKGLGETPDTLERLIAAMPRKASGASRSGQTMMLASGAAIFGAIAVASLVAAPVVVPAAMVIAAGSGILARQSSELDKQRATEAYEAVIDNRLHALEGRAQSKLTSDRMVHARESLLAVKSRAADYGAGHRMDGVSEMEIEEELSEADLTRFFKSLDAVEPDVALAAGPVERNGHGVEAGQENDVSGEEIASLFGVGGNNLFVSSSAPSL